MLPPPPRAAPINEGSQPPSPPRIAIRSTILPPSSLSRRGHSKNTRANSCMGLCVSSGGAASEAAAPPKATALALVLLPTGELRDYPRPATAARALEDVAGAGGGSDSGGGWFLCDSDRMGFEGPVAAVGGAEELRPGRIYFVLPAGARRRGLRREEVAALAVRASAALAARAGNARRRRGGGAAVAPLVLTPAEEEEEEADPAAAAARKAGGRRRLRRFAPDLTAIPECETSE